jgi:DNA polymerase
MPEPRRDPAIAAIWDEVQGCTRCPLYRNATQGVAGEGASHAAVMLVGEQPGDREDLAGRPFVGPAGQILDKALADAGIARDELFVTNAVKHFKNEPRGKRRLHKRPNAYEIDRCRWWLDKELDVVRPRVIVALGATAGRALLGRPVSITRDGATVHEMAEGPRVVITIHPSYVLRLRNEPARRSAYDTLVAALSRARDTARLPRAAAPRAA